ncbi:hypothetical protein BGW37DRAFT_529985 [Umbelopsis sp. PMI_123]|nr:hypothetical protein BGW37DRAFT_529985 [Umbelopsis sp. PMI_123]
MSHSEHQVHLIEPVTVSPTVIHRLVEQIEILQKRLEQLERHSIISATQSLADITAVYDISPIPSRLSISNAISKPDLKSDQIKSRKSETQQPRKGELDSTLDVDEITFIRADSDELDSQPALPSQESRSSTEQIRYDAGSTTANDDGSMEPTIACSGSSESLSGCRTPSLIMSGSTDTVSTNDTPPTSQNMHISPRVSSLLHYDASIQSLTVDNQPHFGQDNESSTSAVHSRQATIVSTINMNGSPISQKIGNRYLQSNEMPTYGRCYSSFFPTTLLPPSPSFVVRTGRLSLATSMRELTPTFDQSGSCLNLLDHIELAPYGPIQLNGRASSSSTLNLPESKKLNRTKRWLTKKLNISPKLKTSASAPILSAYKQPSLLSRKWSKLVGKV